MALGNSPRPTRNSSAIVFLELGSSPFQHSKNLFWKILIPPQMSYQPCEDLGAMITKSSACSPSPQTASHRFAAPEAGFRSPAGKRNSVFDSIDFFFSGADGRKTQNGIFPIFQKS
jgi:hypothetical protein